jgi:hypothetical protein
MLSKNDYIQKKPEKQQTDRVTYLAHKGMWRIYSNPDPHGSKNTRTKNIFMKTMFINAEK